MSATLTRQRMLLVAAIVLPVVLIVAGGCQTNPATGRRQFVLITQAQADQLGSEAKPELTQEYGGEVASSALRSYVDEVGRRVADEVEPEFADFEWSFIVLDSDVINAFALPGGNVFISRGLMEHFDNEAQLAGVLGHEIGHLTGRHVNERISRAMGLQLGVQAVGSMTESQMAVFVADLVSGGYQLKFGRDQETEADVLGVRYMVEAGYDPMGMRQVLEVLAAASENSAPPEFLSTHPHPQTRLDTVDGLLSGEYSYTQGNPEFELYPDRYEDGALPHLPRAGTVRAEEAILAAWGWCGCCGATGKPTESTMAD